MSTPNPSSSANPYAAPTARIDPGIGVESQELAERVTRLGAAIIDGASYAVPAIVVAVLAPAFAFSQGGSDAGGPSEFLLGGIGLVFLVYVVGLIVLNCIWLHRYGQTLGKRLLKVRIVRSNGDRCSLLRVIFARGLPVGLLGAIPLVGWLFSLGDPLMIFREDRRCLHDLIADTIVVKAA